jgi:hypothetical protein
MTYEERRNWLLKTMKKQTDQWLKEEEYEKWQKKNKPKQSYTFYPVRCHRTNDIYDKQWLNSYYQSL